MDRLSVFVMDNTCSESQHRFCRADNGFELCLCSENAVAIGAALIAGGKVSNKRMEKPEKKPKTSKENADKAELDNTKRRLILARKDLVDTKIQLACAESVLNNHPAAKAEYLRAKGK